jgi:ABC-2 type transport system permease protein
VNDRFRAANVIARRDFVATVYSKTFVLFLVGPLVIMAISFLFGSMSGKMAREEFRVRVAVVGEAGDFKAISAARDRLNLGSGRGQLPELVHTEPDYNIELQTKELLASRNERIVAVLTGGLARPRLVGAISETGNIRKQMELILDEVRQERALAGSGIKMPRTKVEMAQVAESGGTLAATRAVTAQIGQLLLFMLTVFLATMLLSNLVEEKSNKVIEILAAAVSVDAIFIGKLAAMLAVSIVGIALWASAGVMGLLIWPPQGGLPEPAVGWPIFAILVVLYYSTNYLLLGALFLGIGSQAASVREVQTLSMPVTVGQMLIFFFALFAVGPFNSPIGIAAAVFPLSSPLAMVARAAQTPELWPHLLALVWQAVWVWLMIAFGAMLFRRNVLKTGSRSRRIGRFGRKAAPVSPAEPAPVAPTARS